MVKRPKQPPLPPGHYTVVIDRMRKIRNKKARRVHMHIVDTHPAIDGRVVTGTIKEE